MNWEEKQLSREIGKGAAAMAGALASRHGLDSVSKRETADFLSQKLAELSGLGMAPTPVRQPIVIDGEVARQPVPVRQVASARPEAVPPAPSVPSPPIVARPPAPAVQAVEVLTPPAPVTAVAPPLARSRPTEAPARRAGRPKALPSTGRRKLAARKKTVKAEKANLRSAARIGRTVFLRRIVSLEDGQSYQDLRPHLKALGLTPDQYRRKHGLPDHYPIMPPALFLKSAEYVIVATF